MGRFDRYILGQLIRVFGFFALVLVLIYWINRAVVLFDRLIADGQTALVFLEFTTLALPNIIRIVLPLAAFAASLYVTNRLATDSELVVVQATGYSALRLSRPVFAFGVIVMILMLILNNLLVPLSQGRLKVREAQVAQNMTARLVAEGQFSDGGPGVTVYIREVAQTGELFDVFLSDSRSETEQQIYTARRAFLIRADAGPQLVMVDGQIQNLNVETNRLLVTRFDELAYDISELIPPISSLKRSLRQIPTMELLQASEGLQNETGRNQARLQFEGHRRINGAALSVVAALLGFVPLLLGGFSRFGLGPQMGLGVALVIVVMALDGVAAEKAQGAPGMWPMTYAGTAAGAAIVLALLAWIMSGSWRNRSRRSLA